MTMARGDNWVLMVPIGNLWLTEAVGRESRVDRITSVELSSFGPSRLPKVPISPHSVAEWPASDA